MTPKEKASELANRMFNTYKVTEHKIAIQCALIAVDSHIYSENNSPFSAMKDWVEDEKFWNEVKSEIEKL